ncbi:MAG: CapA family protein [Sandaracinaceae bacterium]
MRKVLPWAVLLMAGCSESPPPDPPLDVEEPSVAPPPEPVPETPPEPEERTLTIGAGGDILFHLKVWQSAREHEAEGGFAYVFGDLSEIIGDDEVALANLETPLSVRIDPATGDPPVLGAPGSAAAGIAAAGFDAVSVANNHSYDQTATGLADTIAALEEAGVAFAGTDPIDEGDGPEGQRLPEPAWVERDGLRVAFFAFTERVNRGPAPFPGAPSARAARWDDDVVRAAVSGARDEADLIVVSVHWSHDFRVQPLERQHSRARLLVDAGADLVMGHGPHVLQPVERLESPRGEAVVMHSLGNLVSNQALRYFIGRSIPSAEEMHPAVVLPGLRDGAWVRVRFRFEEDRVAVDAIEAVPLWTHNNTRAHANRAEPRLDIRTRALENMDEATREERLPAITASLGDHVEIVAP